MRWGRVTEFRDVRRPDGSVLPASKQITDALRKDPCGIGISSLQYGGAGIQPIRVAADAKGPYVSLTRATLLSREYPLARMTYAFFNRPPGRPVYPLLNEFLRYVYSRHGQLAVEAAGFVPLPAANRIEQLKKLE